jgi:hypothetical protein
MIQLFPRAQRAPVIRYRCLRRPLVRVRTCWPDCQVQSAFVHDIAEIGVWLIAARGLEPGTSVVIRPGRLHQTDDCVLPARVEEAAPLTDGSWLVVCRFNQRYAKRDMFAWFQSDR